MSSDGELEHTILVRLVMQTETAIEDEVIEHLMHGNNTSCLLGNVSHLKQT